MPSFVRQLHVLTANLLIISVFMSHASHMTHARQVCVLCLYSLQFVRRAYVCLAVSASAKRDCPGDSSGKWRAKYSKCCGALGMGVESKRRFARLACSWITVTDKVALFHRVRSNWRQFWPDSRVLCVSFGRTFSRIKRNIWPVLDVSYID